MRLAFEVSSTLTHDFSGIQRYIFELIGAVAALGEPDLQIQLLLRLAKIRKYQLRPVMSWPTRWYFPGPWPAVPLCDVVHGLDMRVPITPNRMFRICTLHDTFYSIPGFGRARTRRRRERLYRRTARAADRIIAVSDASKAEFLNYFDFPAGRIEVIYHGVSAVFLDDNNNAQEQWEDKSVRPLFVAFGGAPRKNLMRQVRGLCESSLRSGFELQVIGNVDDATRETIAKLAPSDSLRFVGKLDDEQIAQLYRKSHGLLFASILEGFGLPILEAMACHAPVLTSNGGATAEVAGGHAVLVNPESIEDIADGIDKLCEMSNRAVDEAADYARTFTWRRTAEQTLALYRQGRD